MLCPDLQKKMKQKIGYRFTNLRSHVLNMHLNYIHSRSTKSNLNDYIRPKSSNLYGWLKRIIFNCQALSIVNNPIELEFTALKPVCKQTLKDTTVNIIIEVKAIVMKMLPSNFCICFNAWTENRIHFVGIYAIFNDTMNNPETVLLGFTTLLDESNWTVQNYADAICNILESFGKSIVNVICLIGDNCNTNKLLSTILNLPLVG